MKIKNFSDEDKALAYGIIGGTPQYLLQLNDTLSIEENIKNTYLNPVSSIYEETSVCSVYIKNLIMLGIVRKEQPYGETSSRKTIYSIEDNMFRFWYRFVPQNMSIISRGATELAYKRIAPHLSDYIGANPKTKRQEEIDIMGVEDNNTALFGECKWKNEKVDTGVLETLVERSQIFHYNRKHYYLFSKSGFARGCEELAQQMGNVTLVSYEQMMEKDSSKSR